MRELLLHIGHDKTGSSYLQATLMNSLDVLESFGIRYPIISQMKRAAQGNISEGNGVLISALFESSKYPSQGKRLFYSSEMLFGKLYLRQEFRKCLSDAIKKHGIDRVRVLLFIRNPATHACSQYQQKIKSQRLAVDIEHFFRNVYATPAMVQEILRFFSEIPNTKIHVRNYDYARNNILPVLEGWLGVIPGSLNPPVKQIVNRSLTVSELELQKRLNKRFGRDAHRLAYSLSNKLPNIRADEVRPSIATQEFLWDKYKEHIEWINERIDPAERYRKEIDIRDPHSLDKETYSFSGQQLDVISDFFADVLKTKIQTGGHAQQRLTEPWRESTRMLFARIKQWMRIRG